MPQATAPSERPLTLDQFRQTRRFVSCVPDFDEPGHIYAENTFLFGTNEGPYELLIGRWSMTGSDRALLEYELYTRWYLPEIFGFSPGMASI